jgi:alpha-D-ribose 1-methylphosphonate 5-triphosphate synthase subunit PhnG
MMDQKTRQEWMGVLAKAKVEELEEIWNLLKVKPTYSFVRPPETGVMMIRGRTGGTGLPFHLGEVTVTRCTLQVKEGFQGMAYVLGRDHRHAELAALFDALLQDPSHHLFLMEFVIRRIRRKIQKKKAVDAKKTASTRVEFFTMVRGE